jgi:hypothetical protein
MNQGKSLLERIQSCAPLTPQQQYEREEFLRDLYEQPAVVHVNAPHAPAANDETKLHAQPPRGRFFRMEHRVFDSPQHNALSHAAQVLLAYMGRCFNGKNNGQIKIPISKLKSRGFNKNSLSRAKIELQDTGFIVTKRRRIVRSPALYALTWLLDPTDPDFDAWVKQPARTREQR